MASRRSDAGQAPVVVKQRTTTTTAEPTRTPTRERTTGGPKEGSSPGQRPNHASKAPPAAPSPLAMTRPSQELSEEPFTHSVQRRMRSSHVLASVSSSMSEWSADGVSCRVLNSRAHRGPSDSGRPMNERRRRRPSPCWQAFTSSSPVSTRRGRTLTLRLRSPPRPRACRHA
jgi:hypothetical protein